jgi:hypothetical protein
LHVSFLKNVFLEKSLAEVQKFFVRSPNVLMRVERVDRHGCCNCFRTRWDECVSFGFPSRFFSAYVVDRASFEKQANRRIPFLKEEWIVLCHSSSYEYQVKLLEVNSLLSKLIRTTNSAAQNWTWLPKKAGVTCTRF